MKKKITLILLCLSLGMYQQAYSQSMAKGRNVFYLGAGAGTGYFDGGKYKGVGYSYRSLPTFHIGFEHGISEAIPQSIIGLGGHLSIWTAAQTYRDANGYGWDKHWTDFSILFRGLYHHKFLVGEKWDVYAAAMAGVRYRTYSFTRNDPYNYYNSYDSKEAGAAPAVGIALGGRYYVSKSFGFYAELSEGYNINTFAQVGFAFKF